ncbi:MAG: SUMF1/EgtB/PvdO family nonheme iron enzyme [bacterium]
MLGNVFEWCADRFDTEGSVLPHPEGIPPSDLRVARGGSCGSRALEVRAAFRYARASEATNGDLGFRLAARLEAVPSLIPSRTQLLAEFGAPDDIDWARDLGRDRFGLWAEIEVKGVRHRLRWIPPGRFWMGSPEGEAGRWEDEGPRHLVTLSRGFWLGETPCTQALWEAVTGKNPSEFKSPTRPVEQVSWNDCQRFLARLDEAVPGFVPRLPSEAEWEYACRAGTETATYAGDLEILGERNAPLLDPIAWYGGNSGKGFDLKKGFDSSDWPEKQYDHRRAGTRPVGEKAPNPWGLRDMLGNVYEWCSDGYGPYAPGAVQDPAGPAEGSLRVLRGGSWLSHAEYVRAAHRIRGGPDARDGYLGFRLARGQGAPGQESERAGGGAARAGQAGTAVGPARSTRPQGVSQGAGVTKTRASSKRKQ